MDAELLKQLKMSLPEEINDVKKYAKLAEMLEQHGEECWTAMVKQMAWEEHTHAKHIMHMLRKNNVAFNEYEQAFKEAEAMLHVH